ncbi:MAG: rRNA maturation RNAse YbeY [Verrucomicrobiia bacterium]
MSSIRKSRNKRKAVENVPGIPHVEIVDRQRKFQLDLGRLERETARALDCLRAEWNPEINRIEIVLVSPAMSGKVHGRFCGDGSMTDVITFAHGELVVCPAVAERQRKGRGLDLHEEVLTYICHGLLHLCGEEDGSEAGFARMARRQDEIRRRVLVGARGAGKGALRKKVKRKP